MKKKQAMNMNHQKSKKISRKPKVKVPTNSVNELHEEDEIDEVEPDQDDFEFYQSVDRNLDFLANLDTGSNTENTESSRKRKRKQISVEDIEADYEKQPRVLQDDMENQHELLPIKSSKGLIQRVENKSVGTNDNNNNENTETKEPEPDLKDNSNTLIESTPLSIVELYARRQQKLIQRRLRIAELSNAVLEQPEENVTQLKELCSYCEENDVDIRITTRKLAIVSLLEVFKDIVPGYTLRLPSETEKETKVSKDVKKTRDFEEGLLLTYQKYLQILEKAAQGKEKGERKRTVNGDLQKNQGEALVLLSVQCLCDLLVSLPHFNYHNNLITVLVPKMNVDLLDGQVSQLCCEAFQNLFKQDKIGNISLEAIKVISKFIKSQSYKVKPSVLQVFLFLRINDMDILSLREKKNIETKPEKLKGQNKRDKMRKAKMSKKERKRQKEMKGLEKELQATQAVEGQEKRAKLQTEILKFVFATYFRVLKFRANSMILSPVLEGLAKHAHLINVDFFADLMSVLQQLINNEDLALRDKLNCALTAFKILSGQGQALNIDPRGFYCTLYTALLQLNADRSNSDVDIVLKCLDIMMKKRTKQIPIQRVSAFTKRLSTVSLQVMPNSTLALLAFVKILFQLHPKSQKLLDSETMGTGVFRPDVEDPELCNTDSTTSWELSYLCNNHYHPTVRLYASRVMAGSSTKDTGSTLTRIEPEEIFKVYDSTDMKLNPDMSELAKTKNQQSKKSKLHVYQHDDLWKDSCIELDVSNAVNFTERYWENSSFELIFPERT